LRKRSSKEGEYSIRLFSKGTILESNSYLLWANKEYATSGKILADETTTEYLAKNNSLALFDKEGNLIDAVCWGTSTNPFVEGNCFPENIPDDKSLARKWSKDLQNYQDTDNNAKDFEIQNLTPKQRNNSLPKVYFNFSPQNPVFGEEISFEVFATDTDGEISYYLWDFGDGIISSSTLATTSHSFSQRGTFSVTLTIFDDLGATSSTSTQIEISPWSFAIITDLHIGRGYGDFGTEGFDDNVENNDYYLTKRLENVVNWIIENKDKIQCEEATCSIKFLVVLGDISDSAEKSEFQKAKQILDKLNNYGIPYIPVFGNHDVCSKTDFLDADCQKGQQFFEEIFFNENATNTKILIEKLNFERDESNTNLKNFLFNYGGIYFIGLDFVKRKQTGRAEIHSATENWLKKVLDEKLTGKESVILLSHQPLADPRSREISSVIKIPFHPFDNFSGQELAQLQSILEEYENKEERIQILANFAGHIHGYYPQEILGANLPKDRFFNANWQYSSSLSIPVLTTEALMVGSNEKNSKGIVRIVKAISKSKINFNNWEINEGENVEFIGLNPYMAYDYKRLTRDTCMIFKGHAFTKKETYLLWKIEGREIGSGEKMEYCFPEVPKIYEIGLTAIYSQNPQVKESIFQKILVKAGIIPKIFKGVSEKIELISTSLKEKLTEIGRTIKDKVLIKVKHSSPRPVGLIEVHFEQATEDIDLSGLVVDFDGNQHKSILFMEEWPFEVERSKILLIQKE